LTHMKLNFTHFCTFLNMEEDPCDFSKMLSVTVAMEYKLIISKQMSTLLETNISTLRVVNSLQTLQKNVLTTLVRKLDTLTPDELTNHIFVSKLTESKIQHLDEEINHVTAKISHLDSLLAYIDNFIEGQQI